jgi:hypothetical protein
MLPSTVDFQSQWLTHYLPMLSFVVSVVATVAAVWALRAVHLSKKAFMLAQRQAAITERERGRCPNLHLAIDGRRESVDALVSLGSSSDAKRAYLSVTIENDGEMPARSIVLDLRLPPGVSDDSYIATLEDGPDENSAHVISFGHETTDFMRRAIEEFRVVLLAKSIPLGGGTMILNADPGEYALPWVITSEEGSWKGVFRVGVRTYDPE